MMQIFRIILYMRAPPPSAPPNFGPAPSSAPPGHPPSGFPEPSPAGVMRAKRPRENCEPRTAAGGEEGRGEGRVIRWGGRPPSPPSPATSRRRALRSPGALLRPSQPPRAVHTIGRARGRDRAAPGRGEGRRRAFVSCVARVRRPRRRRGTAALASSLRVGEVSARACRRREGGVQRARSRCFTAAGRCGRARCASRCGSTWGRSNERGWRRRPAGCRAGT